MATVTLKGIKKIYDKDVLAVSDFNLEIADKEFVVLVGPSGCGKSTTLRMIAGLEEITEGELYIGDRLVNNVAPKDRDIAMVFQNYALYPHMTVYDNMAFSLKLRKMNKKEIDKTVRRAADILDITDYLKRKPKALSGGQKQRVAIGRAIVREPQVFLMDEPLSNLDAKLRNQMRAEIIKLRQRIDTTFVYVTHDQTEAMTLGDRIVIMKDGFIQQTGTPHEVFNHPANLFVAGFIGTPQMNFFDGELKKDGATYFVRVGDAHIALPESKQCALRDAAHEEKDITVGVRPEHIVLLSKDDIEEGLSGILLFSEMMGSSEHLHVKAGDQEVVIVRPTGTRDSIDRMPHDMGATVRFMLPGAACHLFDKETENNLIEFVVD
ncbi:MAG: sn-glycerol-3-phosphate ABC transporter ATP-binding protein UgpC [Clostridiaceae bacterium]|nr:sn-glycerol-3-phosphate ABC transporter ATP-binding protein UgpC [Clostridiaceae bacterium]